MLTWLFWCENSKLFHIFRRCLLYAYTSYYKLTLFCRSTLAPASSSSETTSVQPSLAADAIAQFPARCVMTDVCIETLRLCSKVHIICMSHQVFDIHINSSCDQWGHNFHVSSRRGKYQFTSLEYYTQGVTHSQEEQQHYLWPVHSCAWSEQGSIDQSDCKAKVYYFQ